jgi:chromosome segregation ATPase
LNDKLHTYEVQIKEKNIYINTLETNLASKEERIKYLENLRSKVTTPRNESKFDWVNINGELEYEQKMTEKLSEHIKQLKIENQNLEQELGDKENIIMILNQRLAELSNPNRFNRGTMFD